MNLNDQNRLFYLPGDSKSRLILDRRQSSWFIHFRIILFIHIFELEQNEMTMSFT